MMLLLLTRAIEEGNLISMHLYDSKNKSAQKERIK